jgi:transcriptional regulator with XRE-family HTH domain
MDEQLGDRIRAMRESYGMPASVLAHRVEISRQQLHMIETSKTLDPGALTILRIANELEVSTDYLLKGKRKPQRLTDDGERATTGPGFTAKPARKTIRMSSFPPKAS